MPGEDDARAAAAEAGCNDGCPQVASVMAVDDGMSVAPENPGHRENEPEFCRALPWSDAERDAARPADFAEPPSVGSGDFCIDAVATKAFREPDALIVGSTSGEHRVEMQHPRIR